MTHLNIKVVLLEKHQKKIKKIMKTLNKKIQILRSREIVLPLNYLSNFWRSLAMPLSNCELSLTLTWSENFVFTDITIENARAAQGNNPARPAINAPTNLIFKISDTELYVPTVTLSTEDANNFPEHLKSAFKKTIKWNKYRLEVTNQTKPNNLNYLINQIFNKVNRFFVLSFENEEDRTFFPKYYTPKV